MIRLICVQYLCKEVDVLAIVKAGTDVKMKR